VKVGQGYATADCASACAAGPTPGMQAPGRLAEGGCHRMILHKSDLPGCWATPPPTQAIATGSDVLIAEDLGAMRRAQEQAVADKKKTPKKRWGVEQVSKLLCLTRVPSESELPPIYTALAVGKGVAQDRIILQNAFMALCLEAGAATTTAPIVTPTFA
jgi:hypothetical protein